MPLTDPLFHQVFTIVEIPQIPSIDFWMGIRGGTSERFDDSKVPHVRAIADERGRIMVLMTHNTDFGDAFEREGVNHDYFLTFSVAGYAFGINALIYAMTIDPLPPLLTPVGAGISPHVPSPLDSSTS